MAIFYPDILEHNNPARALVSYSQLRGNAYAIDTPTELATIAATIKTLCLSFPIYQKHELEVAGIHRIESSVQVF